MTANSKYLTMAVPRYTSYPTAPHFSDAIGADDYRDWLSSLDALKPLSIYLHVPFCRQLCWYCGCNMKLASRYGPVEAYVETLMREIDLLVAHLPARMPVSHLHFGGGTPTALSPDDLARIMARIHRNFDIGEDAELAIEGDPRTLSREMVRRIARLGFNRASFGVQEFDARVQKAINRIQPPEMVERWINAFREEGVSSINFDLIFGLPHQTVATLKSTISRVVEMRPDRISLFGYAHVPWMARKQRLIPAEALPGAGERLAQAEAAGTALLDAGYVGIGMDHFALPGDALARAAKDGNLRRNFQGYTTDIAETLVGLGATSIGRTPSGYVQNIAETGAWARTVEAGTLPVARGHRFAGQDLARDAVIQELMCHGRTDLDAIASRFELPLDWCDDELRQLQQYARDGLVSLEGGVRLTDAGRPLVRVVAAVFDEYHARAMARHSVAV